jgi:uncharacterized protein
MTSAPVLSNTSPLIALTQLGQMALLEHLFGTIVIAPAVAVEAGPAFNFPPWITQQALTQPVGPMILQTSLGPGESETISLALETQARLVILDDRPARRLAQALNLRVIGTLGILLAAKNRGLISMVKPCLDALLQKRFSNFSSFI